MDPIATLLFAGIALFVWAFVQVIWTRRMLRQVQVWLRDEEAALTLSRFGVFSRRCFWMWNTAALIAIYVYVDAKLLVGGNAAAEAMIFSFAGLLWCAISSLLSLMATKWTRVVNQFLATRQVLTPDAAKEFALLLPEELRSLPASRDLVEQRTRSLDRLALLLFGVQSAVLAIVLLGLFAQIIDSTSSLFLNLMALIFAIVLPTLVVLFAVRKMVGARSRQAQFLWFLATTVQKQRSVSKELQAWGEANSGSFAKRVCGAASSMAQGDSLADSLRGWQLLSDNDLLSIRIGEQTGGLADTLRDLATRRTNTLRGDPYNDAAIGMAVYLWALLTTGCSIVGFLMYFIVPKFKAIFNGFGTELPGITVTLIHASDLVARYGGLFLFFLPTSIGLAVTAFQAYWHGWSETSVANFLGITRQAEIPRLLRRLRQAVLGKVPWPTVLTPLVREHHRPDIRSRLERVMGRVTAGMSMWSALKDAGLLNGRDVGLLEMAERANNLEWALAALADSKERGTEHRWRVIQTLMVPLFIFTGGLFVAFVAIGFFMPLVKLLNDLS